MLQLNYERLRLLIAEDDPFTRELTARLAQALGFKQVDDAANGQEALRLIDTNEEYDLLICDIEMIPIDGLAVLKAVREHPDRRKARLPVIFLTGHSESEVVSRAVDSGVSAFLLKPPTLKMMQQKIDLVLRLRGEMKW